jgi:predicted Zn-dependent protease
MLIGLLSGMEQFSTLKYDRQQESEADHIGVFLMTFAGYDPRQSVVFWERMTQATQRMGHPPAILSTHPTDAQRMKDLQKWIPRALGGKKFFDEGRIAPPR